MDKGKKNNSFFILSLFLFASLFCTIHSIHWLIPFIELKNNFLPIFFGYEKWDRGGDDYFYFTLISDILNGNIFFSDPVNKDYKNIFSVYNSFNLTLLFASLPGLITKNINHIYMYNYIFFPLLNFLLIGLFLKLFFKSNAIIFFITFASLVFSASPEFVLSIFDILKYYLNIGDVQFEGLNLIKNNNEFYRIPTLLITNIHLLLSIIIIYFYFEKDNPKLLILSLLIILTSVFFSISNFLIIGVFFLIIYFKNFKLEKKKFFLLLYFAICSAPAIIFLFETILNLDLIKSLTFENDDLNSVENIEKTKSFTKALHIKYSLFLFFLFALSLLIRTKFKRLLSIFIFSNLMIYIAFAILLGDEYTFRIYNRGSEIILTLFAFICIFKIIEDFKFFKGNFGNIALNISVSILSIFIVFHLIFYEIFNAKKNINSNKDFTELTYWVKNNTESDKVFVSLDPEINLNLPIYSNANTYLTHTILSRSNLEQRAKRLINILKYYGYSNNQIFKIVISNIEKSSPYNLLVESFVFSYNNDLTAQIKKDEKFNQFFKQEIFSNSYESLIFRSHYILLSNFDRKKIKKGSSVEKVLNPKKIVFSNSNYTIYKIY